MSGLNLSMRQAVDLAQRLGCSIDGPGSDGMLVVKPPPGVKERRTVKARMGHASADRPFARQLRRWERELSSRLGEGSGWRAVAKLGSDLNPRGRGPGLVMAQIPLPWKNPKLEDARRALQRLKHRGDRP